MRDRHYSYGLYSYGFQRYFVRDSAAEIEIPCGCDTYRNGATSYELWPYTPMACVLMALCSYGLCSYGPMWLWRYVVMALYRYGPM